MSMANQPSMNDDQGIWSWNQTPPQSNDEMVHELFSARAHNHAFAPAICSWDGNLTYGELDQLSSRLATHLAGLGVHAEVLVPLFFPKSKWTVVAMMAVLKAGGGVVPMSTSLPEGRIRMILEQTRSPLSLASRDFADEHQSLLGEVFVLDAQSIDKLPEVTEFRAASTPSNTAYILFTSGSTGTPKGAIIEHRQLSTSALQSGKAIGLDEKSRMLQFSAYTFDISILEIMFTLILGGCVCLPSDTQRLNNLTQTMNDLKVTHAFFTPSLLDVIQLRDVQSLRTIITGGEKPSASTVRALQSRFRVIPIYGPCECAVISSVWDPTKGDFQEGDLCSPVGCRFWIVQPQNADKLCRIGEIGELIVEGPIVGRGYLCNEERSRENFIQNPQWAQSRTSFRLGRMYKTGDLARYSEEGKVWSHGRKDNQVKVRGQRLELDEVEVHLRTSFENNPPIPQVKALVASLANHNDASVLIAVIAVAGGDSVGYLDWDTGGVSSLKTSAIEQERFRSWISPSKQKLAQLLPAYAIPSIYIPIRQIPLNSNGKTDRMKLLRLISAQSRYDLEQFEGSSPEYCAPSSYMEERLQSIWISILGVTRIGTQDNFFRVGGDSLQAMKLVAIAHRERLLLTVDQVFLYPVMADMARVCTDLEVESLVEVASFSLLPETDKAEILDQVLSQCMVPLAEIEDIYPATAQQIFSIHAGINSQSFQMESVYRLPEDIELERFYEAWDLIVKTHEILRTRMIRHPSGSGYVQVVVKGGINWRKGNSLEEDLEQEHKHIIRVGEPLFRLGLIMDEHLAGRFLVLTVQHAAYDAWSLSRLFHTLSEVYEGTTCPPPSLKYNVFIKSIVDMDRDAATEFWKTHLADVQMKPFATVAKGQAVFSDAAMTRFVDLKGHPTGTRALSTRVNTALAIIFSHILSCPDVVLGMFGHGRSANLPGVGDMIAPTMTAYPLRIRVNQTERIVDLLDRVQSDISAITPFEQFHFRNIARISPEIFAICMNAVRLNVLPNLTDSSGMKLDLPFVWGQMAISLPFRLTCTLSPAQVIVEASFDQKIISVPEVDKILRMLEVALQQTTGTEEGQKVCDLSLKTFTTLPDSNLVESITEKSRSTKLKMLVS